MRPLDVEIRLYDKAEGEVVGEFNAKVHIKKAVIDLDEVESCFIDIDDKLIICMKSGEAHCTKSYTIDEFKDLWINMGDIRDGSNIIKQYLELKELN